MSFLARLFSLRGRVDRQTYAIVGFTLMFLKYGVDATCIYFATDVFWTPFDYLSPLFMLRQERLGDASPAFQLFLAAWTLPFLWIGVSMTMRRAYDAGHSGWWGLLFFVPIVNYVAMIWLCIEPTREQRLAPDREPKPVVSESLANAMLAVPVSIAVSALLLLFSVYVASSYGMALFAGTPFLLGAVGGFLYNRAAPRSLTGTMGVVLLSVLIAGGVLILFAFEGVICLAMAAPIVTPVALLGGFFGRAVALFGHQPAYPAFAAAFLVMPAMTALEAKLNETASYEVITAIEIDAPPEAVWPNVVSFTELPEPSRLLFRTGIAYPKRARIEGSGVGAVRHCEFSTGSFVEPITRWDEPATLSFDVLEQPPPMHEWSPYKDLQPPHLDGYIQSRRGEFRLIALPGNRTRLEGSTWYDLRIYPAGYWRLWSDLLIHRIHTRVLEHVKRETEAL